MKKSLSYLLNGLALTGLGCCLVQGGEAKAANCFLNNLPSCSQTIGDLQFSGFSFSGFTASATDFFQVDNIVGNAGSVVLNYNPIRTVSTSGSFAYTVTLLNSRNFVEAQAYITGGTVGGGTYNTSFGSSGLPTSATAVNGGSPGAVQTFNSGLTNQAFTQSLAFTFAGSSNLVTAGATFTATGDTFAVPGPLPLLGAGAAFGFSRKLRRRIKQAA